MTLAATSIPGYLAGTWSIDPAHSDVSFSVRHMMVSKVKGRFGTFSGTIVTAEDPAQSSVTAEIDLSSIDTNNAQRDAHLKSPDFFDAETHKQLIFVGKKYEANGDDAKLHGDLTLRGVTKPVTIDVEFGGIVVDPYGQTKAGFTVTGKISRKEFGLTWSAVTEAGQVVVSDEIRLNAEIQLVKQA